MKPLAGGEPHILWCPTLSVGRQSASARVPTGAFAPSSNYWHYLIGYLAPLCREVRDRSDSRLRGTQPILVLQTSSTITDGIARDVLGPHFPEIRFHSSDPGAQFEFMSILQRLDAWSYRVFPWRGAVFRTLGIPLRTYVRKLKWFVFPPSAPGADSAPTAVIPIHSKDAFDWWWDRQLMVDGDYLEDLRALRHYVEQSPRRICSTEYLGKVLVLRRPHTTFQNRGIANDVQLVEDLSQLGVQAVVYEPGAHAFHCQVETFSRATGVVGWRGAEFANIIWCERTVPIIMFQKSDMHGADAPQTKLGELLGFPVTVIDRATANLSVDVDEILEFVRDC